MSRLYVVARHWANWDRAYREIVAFARDKAEAEALAAIYRARGEFAVGYSAEPARPLDPILRARVEHDFYDASEKERGD